MKKNNPIKKENPLLVANVIGATGLVGKHLVELLLQDPSFKLIRIFVRQDTGIAHPKLEQKIIDFQHVKDWEKHLNGDVLFSALGTTLKKAGNKNKQYEVDFRYNLKFANKAYENGIHTYILVSAVGADSSSRLFYNRMKGELDDAVINLKFKKIIILRPSALAGKRKETRWMEKLSIPVVDFVTRFIFKKYRPIEGRTVAQAMIHASINPPTEKHIWTADEIFELAQH